MKLICLSQRSNSWKELSPTYKKNFQDVLIIVNQVIKLPQEPVEMIALQWEEHLQLLLPTLVDQLQDCIVQHYEMKLKNVKVLKTYHT